MSYFSVFCTYLCLFGAAALKAQSLSAPPSGKYDSPVTITFSAEPGATVYYSLDGTFPDTSSHAYQSPVTLDSTSVLRAMAWKDGAPVSQILQRSYLIGTNHVFPVFSFIFEPSAFFDQDTGIYTNFSGNLEAPADMDFFEADQDTAVLSQAVQIEIQGGASASQPQKSLEINPLPGEWLNWPFFSQRPFIQYKRLVLRNSGQDWMVTQFRDAMVTSLVDDITPYTQPLQPPDLDVQAWRPSVVYLNGKYWGIYNIRERMNQHYIRQHYSIDKDSFDLVENYAAAQNGDSTAWFNLFTWMQTHSCAADSNYNYLRQQVNYTNFLDYSVFNVIIDNEDWPGNNNRRWREKSDSGKWRWLCYDLDFTFGLAQPATGGWNTGDPSPDALARLLDSTSVNLPNPDWSTLIFRRFWEQPSFRNDFANRSADWLNTIFNSDRVTERINAFEILYQPEITSQYIRWWFGEYDEIWRQNVEKMRFFAQNRPEYVQTEIRNALPEKNGILNLTFAVEPPGAGNIQVNTLHWNATTLPWSGQYFAAVPLPVTAQAEPGWVFKQWSTPQFFTGDTLLTILQSGDYNITAIFEKEDTTGLKPTGDNQFEVYPNPSSDKVWVKSRQKAPVNYVLFNILGMKIMEGGFTPDAANPVFNLDLSRLIPGSYILQLNGTCIQLISK